MNTATKDIVQQKQQVQAKVEPPKISSYLDYRAFLQDLYQYKKATDGDFSFATWAKKANIKSRSFLRLVIVGKRTLTESVLPALVRSLELEKKRISIFYDFGSL
ncbi:MAG: TIGR02147 family protein [Candidatus Aenigmarchaeota archaeon]|nr:TIGR02147 family protein [Candidatus Aenigmarchaeota archaeon]